MIGKAQRRFSRLELLARSSEPFEVFPKKIRPGRNPDKVCYIICT